MGRGLPIQPNIDVVMLSTFTMANVTVAYSAIQRRLIVVRHPAPCPVPDHSPTFEPQNRPDATI